MTVRDRRITFAVVCGFALALGVLEASVVVYLREIAGRESALRETRYLPNLLVRFASLPSHLVWLEMAREATTLVLLGAVGWLAGRRLADRIGAFLVAFGVWDLAYYLVLRLISGWPGSVGTWDILFLIPSPWVAPVWAPATVATLFVGAGTYLFLTPELARHYRGIDIALIVVAAGLTIAAFLMGSGAVLDHRVPEQFPLWLFWCGVVLGAGWFIRVERRTSPVEGRPAWVGPVRIATVTPIGSLGSVAQVTAASGSGIPEEPLATDVEGLTAQYRDALSQLQSLLREANEWADRFGGLARQLAGQTSVVARPRDEDPSAWEPASLRPFPSLEQVRTLVDHIRKVGGRVDELRERLILMGHGELAERSGGFFE